MAQIPDNNIKPRLIYNEINGTSHGTDAAINAPTGVTMESLRTSSIAYVGGDGASPNVQTTPNRFNEWADYQHTQTMGTIVYNVLFTHINQGTNTWPSGVWGLYEVDDDTTTIANEPSFSEADGGIYLYTVWTATHTYVRADRIKGLSGGAAYNSEGRHYTASNTYASSGTQHGAPKGTFGSITTNDGTSAVTLITIPLGSNHFTGDRGVVITAVRNGIYGSTEGKAGGSNVTGLETAAGGESAGLYLANTAAGANYLDCEGVGCWDEDTAVWRLKLTAYAADNAGYQTTELDGGSAGGEIACFSYHAVSSDSGE